MAHSYIERLIASGRLVPSVEIMATAWLSASIPAAKAAGLAEAAMAIHGPSRGSSFKCNTACNRSSYPSRRRGRPSAERA